MLSINNQSFFRHEVSYRRQNFTNSANTRTKYFLISFPLSQAGIHLTLL